MAEIILRFCYEYDILKLTSAFLRIIIKSKGLESRINAMKKDIFAQEKQRFSIRKYSFGAASVLIGASLVFAGQVAADETGTAKSNSTEPVAVQVSTPTTESSTADQTATSETPVAQADHAETTVKAVEAAVGTDTKSTVSSDSSASAKAEVTTSTDTVTDTASTSGAVSEVSTSQVDSSVASEKTTSEDIEVSSDAGLDAAKITVSNSAQTNVAVEDLLREAKVATTASVSEDRAAVAEKKLPTTGYYTYPERTEVKNTPTVAAPVEFYVNAGDRVFYDKVLTNDGYQWLSYKSYSGIRRYAAITKLTADKPVAAPTGQLSFQNQTPQGFDVLVTNVSDSNGIAAVKVPVWTDKSGQDDLIWYNAAKQANGDYKVAVKVSDHKNELGDYNVHLYYIESTGKMVGVTGTKTTVTNEVPQSGLNLPSQGSYTFTSRVEVKSQPKMSAPTEFTFDKGEKINYDKVLDADSHQWISYVSYSGTRRYIPIALSTQPVKPAIERTGKLTIDSQSNGDFNVVVSEVSDPNGIAEVKVPVWTDKSGQDDLVWYDAAKQSDGTYKVAVKLSDHKNERGTYNVHLYYIDKTGSKHGVTATQTTVAQPVVEKNKLSIENKTSKGFDVIVSNLSFSTPVTQVKVPVWSSQSGQDDLVWYDAAKQSNGNYKVSVSVSNHKNSSGEYNVHLYYLDNTGKMYGIAGTTTTVETSNAEPVFNGSYYSIKGKYDDIIVVNKKYPLSATYNPGENATAKEAFTRLRNDMIAQGLNVGYGYSGFRSYSTQANLYQNYVNRDGQAAADRYSARPGYSEHQTGLAYDLTDKAGNLLEDARASQWLKDNAHNYGFVVRYQPGKEASTGFMEEAWHVRYIGKEAKEVHDSGLTLEEYFGFQGGDYGNVSPAQPSQPTNTGNNLPAQGTYTFTKNCPIKAEPNNASPIITYYPAGDKVNYTSVLNNDGHVWLAYRTYSGAQRYVAID